MSLKVLVTGGAGYKGIKMAEALLKRGFQVTIFDIFYFGCNQIIHLVSHPNLTVIRGDIRNDMSHVLSKHDVIIHLAGISGFPACVSNPGVAMAVNVTATAEMVRAMSRDQLLLFASTTAMYETAPDIEVDENLELSPSGMYTRTKKEAEVIIHNEHPNSISLRVATVMGLSPRMRTNLLVNDFVWRAVSDRSLVLYHASAKRTFIHIDDCVRGYLFALDHRDQMSGGIYNLGSSDLNYSKIDIANAIKKHVECDVIESVLPDRDVRNFTVSFKKIRDLGFDCEISLENTIEELIKLYRFYRPSTDESLVF